MEASRATLAARYEAGATLRQLGAEEGMSHTAVLRRLRAARAQLRPGGPVAKPKPAPRPHGRPRKPKPAPFVFSEFPLPAPSPMDGRSWEQAMTARLIEVRSLRPRWTFAEAWRQSIRDYPTPARQQALPGDALFDEWGDAQVTLAAFFEAACRDAWHGDRPALRHFSSALLLGADDGFTSPDAVIA